MKMKPLSVYLLENKNELSAYQKQRLILLDQEYGALRLACSKNYSYQTVYNYDEEKEKFLKALKAGEKYFPVFKIKKPETQNIGKLLLDKLYELRKEFSELNIFLTKYYISNINWLINSVKWYNGDLSLENVQKEILDIYRPSEKIYKDALQKLGRISYDKKHTSKKLSPDQLADKLAEYIKSHDLDCEIKLSDKITSRIMVVDSGKILISDKAVFYDYDVDNLIQHEIEGHLHRKINSNNLGLYLFKFGTVDYKIYDEGLAIWNTYNRSKSNHDKNLWTILMRCVAGYLINKLPFDELYDKLQEISPAPPEIMFGIIARAKRFVQDTSIMDGLSESMYYDGYVQISEMDVKTRNKCRIYRIGPSALHDLHRIEEFFKLNSFQKLS